MRYVDHDVPSSSRALRYSRHIKHYYHHYYPQHFLPRYQKNCCYTEKPKISSIYDALASMPRSIVSTTVSLRSVHSNVRPIHLNLTNNTAPVLQEACLNQSWESHRNSLRLLFSPKVFLPLSKLGYHSLPTEQSQ